MTKGTVKWFNRRDGYGFIIPDGSKEEVFVHQSNLVREYPKQYLNLYENDRVIFDLVEGAKGKAAENVRVIR